MLAGVEAPVITLPAEEQSSVVSAASGTFSSKLLAAMFSLVAINGVNKRSLVALLLLACFHTALVKSELSFFQRSNCEKRCGPVRSQQEITLHGGVGAVTTTVLIFKWLTVARQSLKI